MERAYVLGTCQVCLPKNAKIAKPIKTLCKTHFPPARKMPAPHGFPRTVKTLRNINLSGTRDLTRKMQPIANNFGEYLDPSGKPL